MSAQAPIREFFEVLNKRNFDKIHDLLDADAALYFPKTQPLISTARILKFLNILFRQYPQLKFEIQRIIVEGNQAAVHWTNQGTNKRDLPYENDGVTLIELQDGKIIFISDFFKDTEKF